MNAQIYGSALTPPLNPEQQRAISSRKLARLIMEFLIRNDLMVPAERNWKVSYYPYDLTAIRQFEIVGHSNPEVPEFRKKWEAAIALLKSKAFIMNDPSQDRATNFMMPTEFATPDAMDEALGD